MNTLRVERKWKTSSKNTFDRASNGEIITAILAFRLGAASADRENQRKFANHSDRGISLLLRLLTKSALPLILPL
jgi:hypothetical protein